MFLHARAAKVAKPGHILQSHWNTMTDAARTKAEAFEAVENLTKLDNSAVLLTISIDPTCDKIRANRQAYVDELKASTEDK